MDDDSVMKSKVKNEVKDGYVQLAEKMEQVRSQMAKMERKYDELYQSVKEKEYARNPSVSSDQAADASKSPRESVADSTGTTKSEITDASPKSPEKPSDEGKDQQTKGEMDIDKLEDNPFL